MRLTMNYWGRIIVQTGILSLLLPAVLSAAEALPSGDFGPDARYYYRAAKQCANPDQIYFKATSVLRIKETENKPSYAENYMEIYLGGKKVSEEVSYNDARDLLEPASFSRVVRDQSGVLLRREKMDFYPLKHWVHVVRQYSDATLTEDNGIDKQLNEVVRDLPPDIYCSSMIRHAFRYFPFEVGQEFNLGQITRLGKIYYIEVKVNQLEKITVPAGEFRCFRVIFYPRAKWVPKFLSAFIPWVEVWYTESSPHRVVKIYGIPQPPASFMDYQAYFDKFILIALENIRVGSKWEELTYAAYDLPLCQEQDYFRMVWEVKSGQKTGEVVAGIGKLFASGNISDEKVVIRQEEERIYPVSFYRKVSHPSRGMLRHEEMEFIPGQSGLAKPLGLKIYRNYADPLFKEDHGLETLVDKEERAIPRHSYSLEMVSLALMAYPFSEGQTFTVSIITRIGRKQVLIYSVGTPRQIDVEAGQFQCFPVEVFPSIRTLPARLTQFLPRFKFWYTVASPHILIKYQGPPDPPSSLLDVAAFREQDIDIELERVEYIN